MSSTRVGPVGSQPNRARVRSLDAERSIAKNAPMNPKCSTASSGRDRGHRQAQAPADGLGDRLRRHALLGDGVQAGARRRLLEPEPDQPRGVRAVHGRPPVRAVADVRRDALLAGHADDVGDEPVVARRRARSARSGRSPRARRGRRSRARGSRSRRAARRGRGTATGPPRCSGGPGPARRPRTRARRGARCRRGSRRWPPPRRARRRSTPPGWPSRACWPGGPPRRRRRRPCGGRRGRRGRRGSTVAPFASNAAADASERASPSTLVTCGEQLVDGRRPDPPGRSGDEYAHDVQPP